MTYIQHDAIIEEYRAYLMAKEFPCVAARAAMGKKQIKCLVAGHMASTDDDNNILAFLYDFIDQYRNSATFFHSASVIFTAPELLGEELFEELLWQRLQALSDLDSKSYGYDKRVSPDPASAQFSFSIKEEAFFVIGLHAASSRPARRFKFPTLAFNPHAQFEELREKNRYVKMKNIVRKHDLEYSGSVNPMLEDFGNSSEVFQYSGRVYSGNWKCPLKANHTENESDSPS